VKSIAGGQNAHTSSSPVVIKSGVGDLSLKRAGVIEMSGIALLADPAGALYWPEEAAVIVADLHLEKGSAFAARGMLLPPYDTAATLGRPSRLIDAYAPRVVISLGDSFHDGDGPTRISAADRALLATLQRRRDWVWIAGNHDPDPASIGGTFARTLARGPLVFTHQPTGADGEIAGHLHPCARIVQRGRSLVRRCFACDGRRLVMPAFGAYAGGLNIRDRAFCEVFGALDFTAHLLGARRIYSFAAARCLTD
jgi:uncharacterized protein